MAKIKADQPLLPSVLDRLIDEEPGVRRDPPQSRTQVLRELKQSVRRDLENLLNTRQRSLPHPQNLTELERSLVSYGMPDVIGTTMAGTEGREQLRQLLEETIRRFEPRFKTVKVELLDAAESLDRTLRFRIDALLHATPAPEPVTFDSALEPVSGSIDVRGVGS
jgi:type VI secretion system protein ImpF